MSKRKRRKRVTPGPHHITLTERHRHGALIKAGQAEFDAIPVDASPRPITRETIDRAALVASDEAGPWIFEAEGQLLQGDYDSFVGGLASDEDEQS